MYVLSLFLRSATVRFESHELTADTEIGVLALLCLFGVWKVFKVGVEVDRAEQEEMDEKRKRDLDMSLPL